MTGLQVTEINRFQVTEIIINCNLVLKKNGRHTMAVTSMNKKHHGSG